MNEIIFLGLIFLFFLSIGLIVEVFNIIISIIYDIFKSLVD